MGFTKFGKDIKKRLVDIEKTQEWLIAQVSEKTGLYFDSRYLYRIMSGENNPHTLVSAIREILDL